MEAQPECAHVAYTFLHVWAPICMLSRCSVTKFLHRSSVGSLLRVRFLLGENLAVYKIWFLDHSTFPILSHQEGSPLPLLHKPPVLPPSSFFLNTISNIPPPSLPLLGYSSLQIEFLCTSLVQKFCFRNGKKWKEKKYIYLSKKIVREILVSVGRLQKKIYRHFTLRVGLSGFI